METQSIFEKVFGSNKREIQLFRNEELDLQMRTILNDDGSISVNAEDTAIGLGWITVAKSGNEVVRWARLNGYLKEFGFAHECAKDDYIPESLYYLLAMKANNRRAQKFQKWLAIDVIPEIRRTGSYNSGEVEQTVTVTEANPVLNPELMIRASEAMSGCLEGNRPYVLNILRHIIPDIGELPLEETTTEVTMAAPVPSKNKRNPRFIKEGVDIDIKKLLLELGNQGLTVEVVARRAQVCVTTVSGWIAGKHKPVLQNRINLCKALGKDEDFLTPRRERRRR